MIFMCLDHTREFFGDLRIAPEDPATTTPILFFTRWITHFCAPTFIFLAGVSAWLYGQKVGSKRKLAKFLVTRGVWLIFLEFTVVHFGWLQCVGGFPLMFIVIAAIGASMIALAGLIFLPRWMLIGFSLVVIFFHNTLDSVSYQQFGPFDGVWILLHQPGPLELFRMHVSYPILPWIGVIAAGYSFGPILQLKPESRHHWCLSLGAGCVALFLMMRTLDVYGDSAKRLHDASWMVNMYSFLACTKYPPSLLYLLMTLGPALIMLALLDLDADDNESKPASVPYSILLTFGRVPLFFYVVHLYLIHSSSRLLYRVARGEPISPLQTAFRSFQQDAPFPEIYGFDLWVVYVAWILMLLILWPLCVWFGRVKRNGHSSIWSYL